MRPIVDALPLRTMTDPEDEYRKSLEVTIQWLNTWHRTSNFRARDIAVTCSQIARERFAVLQRERIAGRNYHSLATVERRAEMDALVDEVRASIAECRELLETWPKTG